MTILAATETNLGGGYCLENLRPSQSVPMIDARWISFSSPLSSYIPDFFYIPCLVFYSLSFSSTPFATMVWSVTYLVCHDALKMTNFEYFPFWYSSFLCLFSKRVGLVGESCRSRMDEIRMWGWWTNVWWISCTRNPRLAFGKVQKLILVTRSFFKSIRFFVKKFNINNLSDENGTNVSHSQPCNTPKKVL